MLWKLEGLSEYDVRRPLTQTGTNLLGLVKHLSVSEAWYFGDVFGRPFPGHWRRWDDDAGHLEGMWAAADESRAEIVDQYRRAWEYSDATIADLDVDAPGHVPWWPRPDVMLFNILVHMLTDQPARRPDGHPARTTGRSIRIQCGELSAARKRGGLLGEPPGDDRAGSKSGRSKSGVTSQQLPSRSRRPAFPMGAGSRTPPTSPDAPLAGFALP